MTLTNPIYFHKINKIRQPYVLSLKAQRSCVFSKKTYLTLIDFPICKIVVGLIPFNLHNFETEV